jgi:predicted nuclease of predicted toxin-antitoxin system
LKILLDSCVSRSAREQLEAAGHDVATIDNDKDPGDENILRRALDEQRILLTLDKDFGALAILHNQSHCGIVRLVGVGALQQGLVCLQALAEAGDELADGAIITANKWRLRKRPGTRRPK